MERASPNLASHIKFFSGDWFIAKAFYRTLAMACLLFSNNKPDIIFCGR